MNTQTIGRPVDILLVEDSPGDVRLVKEAMKEDKVRKKLHVVIDGEEALDFLHRGGASIRMRPAPTLSFSI